MTLIEHLMFPFALLAALFQRRRERAELARFRTGAGKVALGYRVSAGARNGDRPPRG